MKKKKKGMGEVELLAAVDNQIKNSVGYLDGELSDARRKAMEYYLGEPFGNEVQGRSQVISRDVMDTVEWMMPSLLKTFTATDDAIVFDPVGQEDEEAAQQETDYTNHVFYKDNEGFLILHSWMKDALLQKNGIVKCYFDEVEETKKESYQNLSELQYERLLMGYEDDEKIEPIAYTERVEEVEVMLPTGAPMMQSEIRIDVEILKTCKVNRIKIFPIPPERFGVNRGHNSLFLEDADFCYHEEEYTASQLIEMGISPKLVEQLPTGARRVYRDEDTVRRYLEDEQPEVREYADQSMRRITVYECYIRVDYDGDGIAELRKVLVAGNKILQQEEVDRIPFHALCPVPLPHTFIGLSVADLVMDLQLLKSAIWRQTVDNLFFQNNSRNLVDQTRVNMNDLLITRPGAPIRVNGDPSTAVIPMQVPNVGDLPYRMLEYCDKIRDGRTGVSQGSMGLDTDLLKNNKGDESVQRLMTAAEQRVELIARIFAETGIKSLFLHIHELIRKHQDKKRVVRLRNKWVEVDPTEWKERMDMTINIGLGTGERDKLKMTMLQVTQLQQQAVAGGGLDVLVTPKNIYNTAKDFLRYSGIKDPDKYFNDPDTPEAQQEIMMRKQAAAQGDPTVEAIKMQAQVEAERNQIKLMENQMKAQLEQKKLELQLMEKDALIRIERERTELDREKTLLEQLRKEKDEGLKRDEMMQNLALKLTELETKYQMELSKQHTQNEKEMRNNVESA